MQSSRVPFFSIITVCWNAEKEIESTLKSVCNQDCTDREYIVVDGASTDKTLDVIRQFAVDTLISEKDKGIYNAMNKGLKMSKGEYCIFMNSGDVFASENVLNKVKKYILESGSHPNLVYGDYIRVDYDGTATQIIPSRKVDKIWYGMFASHQSIFYNVLFLKEEKLEYDESYKIAADYKLTLEVVHRSGLDNIMQLQCCISRFILGGVSHVNQNKGLKEADRARKEVLNMTWTKRMFIYIVQRCVRPIRENKMFKYIYGLIRY